MHHGVSFAARGSGPALADRVAPPVAAEARRPVPHVAIIVPTLNERDNILPLIEALDRVLAPGSAEIVFVDDWSRDGTPELVLALARERPDIRLLQRYGRRGLSSAVIEGMFSTAAEIVAVIDGDLQHDERILPDLVAAVASGGADVAIGSRYRAGGSCGDWDASRALASRLATRMAAMAVGPDIADPLSGFFALRRELALELAPGLRGGGYKILLDMLSSAPRPLTVCEVPYRFRSRTAGESKLSTGVVLDYLRLIAMRAAMRAATPARAAAVATALLALAAITTPQAARLEARATALLHPTATAAPRQAVDGHSAMVSHRT